MDADSRAAGRYHRSDVVWLFDAGIDADLSGPLAGSPRELFDLLEDAVADAGLVDVAVTGTITGLRRRPHWSGFDLVELKQTGDAPAATVRCVVFARQLTNLDPTLCEGALVTAIGELRCDPAWGTVRIVVDDVVLKDERSAAASTKELLVQRLLGSGAPERQWRLALPERPRRIGILASGDSAGSADLYRVLEASPLEWQLLHQPVPMAGPRAVSAVADGLAALVERHPDVIVIARGGGARGELTWADSETVADAIVDCPVPVWTAIGHANDTTVADLVADRACPTPSAAAHALVEHVQAWERRRRDADVRSAHQAQVDALAKRARLAWRVTAAVVVLVVLDSSC